MHPSNLPVCPAVRPFYMTLHPTHPSICLTHTSISLMNQCSEGANSMTDVTMFINDKYTKPYVLLLYLGNDLFNVEQG